MKSTMELLEQALATRPAAEWHKTLGLSKNALHAAKHRGKLSPVLAGSIAEELGLDPIPWIAIAAIEGEKDCACKSRMLRKFLTGAALAGAALTTALPASAAIAEQASVYYVKSTGQLIQ